MPMKWTLNPKVDIPTSPIAKSAVSISEHSVGSANMLTVILTVHLQIQQSCSHWADVEQQREAQS